jgi:hypothetical protein
MTDNRNLYFIPIIARALESEDPKQAMEAAFDEIHEIGKQPEYKEGFRQFEEFVKIALLSSYEDPEERIQQMRETIHRLIHDLATGVFDDDEKQKKTLEAALRSHPEWHAEYMRIREESQPFLTPEAPINVEVLKGDEIIGSFPIPAAPSSIVSISPGTYTVQLSNGRVLWEGELTREDVIWTYAFPQKDLPMAAKTEAPEQESTKTIQLLNGELIMEVFAGLETGTFKFTSGQDVGSK